MKFLIRFLLSLVLAVSFHSIALAQEPLEPTSADVQQPQLSGQVLEDMIDPANTPALQTLSLCLPPHYQQAQATQYGILSTADVQAPDGSLSKFFYIQVHYTPQREGQVLPYDWQTVVELNSSNQCILHNSSATAAPLDQLLPPDIASQFVTARYTYMRDTNPQEFQEMVDYFSRGGGVSEMRAINPSDDVEGCTLYAEEQAALELLGIQISSACSVRQ